MKKYFFVAIVLVLVLSACKKDSNSSSSGSSSGSNGNSTNDITSIEANNVINSSNDIATVKLLIVTDDDFYPDGQYYVIGYELATAKYENNGFKLKLPEKVPDEYLHNAYELYVDWSENSFVVSNKQAKMSWGRGYEIGIVAYNSEGRQIGYFNLEQVIFEYVYVDRDFTVKGKCQYSAFEEEVNCSFLKGWNIQYYIHTGDLTYEKVLYTTTKPTGKSFWRYTSYESEYN